MGLQLVRETTGNCAGRCVVLEGGSSLHKGVQKACTFRSGQAHAIPGTEPETPPMCVSETLTTLV